MIKESLSIIIIIIRMATITQWHVYNTLRITTHLIKLNSSASPCVSSHISKWCPSYIVSRLLAYSLPQHYLPLFRQTFRLSKLWSVWHNDWVPWSPYSVTHDGIRRHTDTGRYVKTEFSLDAIDVVRTFYRMRIRDYAVEPHVFRVDRAVGWYDSPPTATDLSQYSGVGLFY